MRLILTGNMPAARAAAAAAINARAGALRAAYLTRLPGQDMVYLEKAAEARRFLDRYPDPADDPVAPDPDPATGFPFLLAEAGLTAPDFRSLARVWLDAAATFRAASSAIETLRLGHIASLDAATTPAEISAIARAFQDAADRFEGARADA